MANQKITELTQQSGVNTNDWIELANSDTNISRRVALTTFMLSNLENNTWFTADDFDGNTVNILKITEESTIQFGMPVEISSLYIQPDSGEVTIVDQAVTSQSSNGTDIGFRINVAAELVCSFIATSQGTGGITNKRMFLPDNNYIDFGTGNDGKIYSNGTDTIFDVLGNSLILNNNGTDNFVYDSTSFLSKDNSKFRIGTGADTQIFHDASNTIINHDGTGNLQFHDNSTLICELIATGLEFQDNKALILGTGSDLFFYFDGTDTVMRAVAGDIYIDAIAKTEVQVSSSTILHIDTNGLVLQTAKKLYFDGGGNTYIQQANSDVLLFYVGGQEACRMVEDGNIAAIHLPEITTPTPIATMGAIYTKSDNKLYFQSGDGVEHELSFAAP